MIKLNKERKEEIGLARYAGIAPLVTRPPDETKSIIKTCREICARGIPYPDGTIRHPAPDTVYKWWRSYEKDGFDALIPKARSDTGVSRVLDEDIKAKIRYYKKKYPKMGAALMQRTLAQEGAFENGCVSESTILRYMHQIDVEENTTDNKDMHRYEREHINEVWYGDSCVGPYMKDEDGHRKKVYIILLIDDASRYVVAANLFFNDNFINLMSVLKSAVSRVGKPYLLSFDNGKPYRNKQMELLCARLGVSLNYCQPRTPTSKSKVERMFGTVRTSFLASIDTRDYTSLDALRDKFHEFIQHYNQSTHSSLQGSSPQERFFDESERIRRLSQDDIDKIFLLEITRKVSADSVVVIDNTEYEVDSRFARQTLCIRYSPDRKEVYIAGADGSLTPIRLLNKHENALMKRRKVHLSANEDSDDTRNRDGFQKGEDA